MRRYLSIASIVLLTACASIGNEITSDKIAQIHPGVTTYAQMTRIFGDPMTRSLGIDGKTTAMWVYTEYRSGFWTDNLKTQNLSVLFFEDDRVERYVISGMDEKIGLFAN